MSRGELTREELESIAIQLPDTSRVSSLITPLSPDFIALRFSHGSNVPTAAVCLDDARHRMEEIHLALHEFHAHRIHYRSKKNPPESMTATWLERFFLDDAALRIYAAWQHLQDGLRYMEGIPEGDLKPYKRRFRSRSSVSLYLEKERPQLKESARVAAFESAQPWVFVHRYRNDWVHRQPPTIAGLGLVYHREGRWKPQENGSMRLMGGHGGQPKLTIDELHENVDGATRGFIDALQSTAERYHEILAKAGFTVNDDGSLQGPMFM